MLGWKGEKGEKKLLFLKKKLRCNSFLQGFTCKYLGEHKSFCKFKQFEHQKNKNELTSKIPKEPVEVKMVRQHS